MVAVDAVIGYLHRCHEKLGRDAHLRAVPVDRFQDRLRRGHDRELAYVLGGGEGRQDRRPQARAAPARDRGRAAAHRLALPVARHVVHRHGRRARRRRDDLSLRHPRARVDARPLRGADRAPACSTASIRWAASATTSPAGWAEQCRADAQADRAAHRRVRGRCSSATRSSWRGPRAWGDLARAGARPWGSPGRSSAARASTTTSGGPSPTRPIRSSTSRSRWRWPATASRATACGWSSFASRSRSSRQVLEGLPEGPISSRPGVKSVGQVRVPKGEGYARVEGAARRAGLLPGRRRRPQAVPPQVAGRVLLQPRRAAPHHPRPQDCRRRRDHGLGRPRVRRGRPVREQRSRKLSRTGHPRFEPAAPGSLQRSRKPSRTGHPRLKPAARGPLQRIRKLSRSGHPRFEPAARGPLQRIRKLSRSGHPRFEPAARGSLQ